MKALRILLLSCGSIVIAAVLAWELVRGGVAIDAHDTAAVEKGRAIYATHCAACHGANLEGQPDWREPLSDGTYPPPPQDASGHSWLHTDTELFVMVRDGDDPDKPAPLSFMPAFSKVLADDQIIDVLAFIKSNWPPDVQHTQEIISTSDLHALCTQAQPLFGIVKPASANDSQPTMNSVPPKGAK